MGLGHLDQVEQSSLCCLGQHATLAWPQTYRFAGLRLHAEIPLIPLLGLVHFWISLALLVFRGGWSGDQGGINDRALLHGVPFSPRRTWASTSATA